jgi:hypothetical protein
MKWVKGRQMSGVKAGHTEHAQKIHASLKKFALKIHANPTFQLQDMTEPTTVDGGSKTVEPAPEKSVYLLPGAYTTPSEQSRVQQHNSYHFT